MTTQAHTYKNDDVLKTPTQPSQAVEAAVLDALPNFQRQDDYLLAGGASVMSENCHEIIHVDTLRKIIAATSAELARPLEVPDAQTFCQSQVIEWATSKDWMAGWDACRREFPFRGQQEVAAPVGDAPFDSGKDAQGCPVAHLSLVDRLKNHAIYCAHYQEHTSAELCRLAAHSLAASRAPEVVSAEPVAWRRQESGFWIYYETKAWNDLEPLYTAPPSTAPAQEAEPSLGIKAGETIEQAAEGWAQWCEARGNNMLAGFLRKLVGPVTHGKFIQPNWGHVYAAFIDGARECYINPTANDDDFKRAADGYTKRLFEEVDPASEHLLRTGGFATPPGGAGGDVGAKPRKIWPFVESPVEFTERLRTAIKEFGDLLPAVRNVLIENPAQIKQGADGPLSELTRERLSGVEGSILPHQWRDSPAYGGEICASCGAVKGSARGMRGCATHAAEQGDAKDARPDSFHLGSGASGRVHAFTPDEILECIEALSPDHDGSDFESECPACTAYRKLAAILASKATAAGEGK